MKDIFIHPTAEIEGAEIGEGTKIWHFCHIMKCKIGKNCTIGQGVFIQDGVTIGDNCKIQNGVNIYKGVTLEDNVFVGPSATFTNVRKPKAAIKVDPQDYTRTYVRKNATIGANSTIVCGVEIGERSMIGAGAVITRNIPPNVTVVGNPAGILINDIKGNSFVVSIRDYEVTHKPRKKYE